MHKYNRNIQIYRDLIPFHTPIGVRGSNNSNKRGGSLKLAGQGSTLAGGGLSLTGEGWKTGVGATLSSLAGLGALGHIGMSTAPEGFLGAAVLGGIGALMIYSDKKKKGKGMTGAGQKKIVDKHIMAQMKLFLKKHPQHMVGGGVSKSIKINRKHVVDFIREHKDKVIHIRDVFGKEWKKKGKLLLAALEEARKQQEGQGVFSAIGKASKKLYKKAKHVRDKAFKVAKNWANGKYGFKPSHLMTALSVAVGVAGAASALIPGVDLISVPAASGAALGLKSVSYGLASTGRGSSPSLAGGAVLPKKHLSWIKRYPQKAKKVLDHLRQQSGSGILKKVAVGVGGLALYGFLKENPHLIDQLANAIKTHLVGGMIQKKPPQKILKYLSKYPQEAKRIAEISEENKQIGSGKASSFLAAVGLTGTAAAAGAYGMYQYLLANPVVASKIAAKGAVAVGSAWLGGSGLSISGGCKGGRSKPKPRMHESKMDGYDRPSLPHGVSMLGSGKIKKDRYAVFHGYYPKTSSGLTKADFFLKGKKVVSKKKSAFGKRMKQEGKGIYAQ